MKLSIRPKEIKNLHLKNERKRKQAVSRMKFDDDGFTLIYDGHQEEGRQLLNYHYYYYSLSDLLLRMTLYIYCMTLIYYYYLASIILYTLKLEKECLQLYVTECSAVTLCVLLYMYATTKMCFWSHTQQLFMTN